jgi:hypothetical protein
MTLEADVLQGCVRDRSDVVVIVSNKREELGVGSGGLP